MISKCFEIRDDATFIPVLAVKLSVDNEGDRYLLARSGFGSSRDELAEYVYLIRIYGGSGQGNCDPHHWTSRTMGVAHQYIIQNFDTLEPGDVVDVQFILGERPTKKKSERHDEF